MTAASALAPGGLLSLWVLMHDFEVGTLLTRLAHLERFERELRGHLPPEEGPMEPQMEALGQPMWTGGDSSAFTTHAGRKWIWAFLGPMQKELEPLGVPASQLEIQHIWNHSHRWTRRQLADGLQTLRWKIEQELRERFFVYLDASEAKLYGEAKPFGDEVATAFPSAEYDIREAAQSYALGRHTACVFHCMRTLEYGLRALAADVGRTFDRQQWHNVIDEIESEINTLRKTGPKSATKDERLKWLSESAKEFAYFKDGWRNYVAHGRSQYDGPQALSAFEHVRSFMRKLSEKLAD